MRQSSPKIIPVLSVLVVLSLLLSACGAAETPTPTEEPTQAATKTPTPRPTRTPTATPTEAPPPQTLTVCLGQEPASLYPFGALSVTARSVLSAIYDGPIDQVLYKNQSPLLEKLPSLEDGDAMVRVVPVGVGYKVIDADGNPVTLAQGMRIRPSGCTSDDCVLTYDGQSVVNMDQMAVTFQMRDDILWSDGTPLTALDSAFGYFLDSSGAAPGSQYLLDRTEYYDAVEDYVTEWRGKPGYLDDTYSANFWMPAPEHVWGDFETAELPNTEIASRAPLGWGPYMIQQWVAEESIQLIKNPNFDGDLYFDTVVFRFASSPDNAIGHLLDGTCDVIDPSVPLDGQLGLLRELQQSGKARLYIAHQPVIEKLEFGIQSADPTRPSFFGDARTRKALAMCLNRPKAVETVLYNIALTPNTYLSSQDPDYLTDAERYLFDPTAGSALLEEVGWLDHDSDPRTPRQSLGISGVPNSTPLTLDYVTTTALQRRQVSEILAESLSQCGVQVNLIYLSPDDLYAAGPDGPLFGRQFDLAQFSMGALGSSPSCEWYSTTAIPRQENNWIGTNLAGYQSVAYDQACRAALLSLPGQADYLEKQYATQSIFAQDLPFVPLYTRLRIAASRADLCNFDLDPLSSATFWNIESLAISDDCGLQ